MYAFLTPKTACLGLATWWCLILCAAGGSSAQAPDPIRDLFEVSFVEAWTARDAQAIAELWVEDGDWSSVVGSRRVVKGTAALRGVWEVGLGSRSTPAELALDVDVDHVRRLSDTHALVDLVMTLAPGTPTEMREAFVMVVTRVDGTWRIESARAARLGG